MFLEQPPIRLDQGRLGQIRLRPQALLPFVRKHHGRPLRLPRLPMLVHKIHQNMKFYMCDIDTFYWRIVCHTKHVIQVYCLNIYIYILKLLHRMLSSLQTLPKPVFSWVWSLEDSGLISKLREAWCCKGYACKTGREKDTSEELHQIHNQSQSYFLYFNDAGMYLSFDLKNPEKRTLTSLPNFNCIVRSVGHPTVGVAKGHNFESLGTTGAYKSFMFLRIHFFIL